jgi:solute carrier family 13 (sodium-dependent dicarboxylate transporter), member 2/3/5
MSGADPGGRVERALRTVGLVAGPALALVVFAWNPGEQPLEARRLLAIVALTVTWWATEALPLPATALLGSALAIATGVAPARQVLAPYADPVIFLFMGSFLLAEAFRRHGLDVRVASALLSWRVFARSPRGMLAGFGATSAAVSSILSNTATAALLAPVAMGALDAREGPPEGPPRRADSAVLLLIAYGASIGGMATLIGTPPNLLAAGFLDRLAGVRVGFTGWLLFGVPLALAVLLVALLVTRLLLGRALAGDGDAAAAPVRVAVSAAGSDEGARRAGARWTVAALLLALALWTAPAVAAALLGRQHPLAAGLDRHFPEAGVALLCGALLFAAPTSWRRRRFALSWDDAQRINWGVLLLFGGGLSLGTLADATGLARWVGEGVVRSGLASSPEGLLFASLVAALVVTEFASNTAAATLLIPVVIATAMQAGFDPVPPAIGVALACTCAFVFPVSTPPNAIVFGTGRVPLTRMIRTGFLLDLACLFVLFAGLLLLGPWLPRAV